MLDWLRGLLSRDKSPRCLGCGGMFPAASLVLVNHCYHRNDVRGREHRACAGLRLLCSPCHQKQGTLAWYGAHLDRLAAEHPDQYPWDLAREGMERYLVRLAHITATACCDPTDDNELEIAWHHRPIPDPAAA